MFRSRVYIWLRKFLSIDALTLEMRKNFFDHQAEVSVLRQEIAAMVREHDTFKAALRKAADRAPQRQASTPTDFDAAQIIALDSFKENA